MSCPSLSLPFPSLLLSPFVSLPPFFKFATRPVPVTILKTFVHSFVRLTNPRSLTPKLKHNEMAPGNRGRAGKFGKPQRGGSFLISYPSSSYDKLYTLLNDNLTFLDISLGGKKFSRNLAPLEADEGSDIPEGMWGVSRNILLF